MQQEYRISSLEYKVVLLMRQCARDEIEHAIDKIKSDNTKTKRPSKTDMWFKRAWYRNEMLQKNKLGPKIEYD